jgi:hypothetical protein
MTSTLNLALVCATVLAAVAIAARALAGHAARRAQLQREIAMHERAQLEPTRDLAAAVHALTVAAGALQAATGERAPAVVGHRVTVHTKQPDDQTLFGVVVADYTDRLVLDDAEYVTPQGASPLPGRQRIRWDDIAWTDDHGHVEHDRTPETAEQA